jgi:hypothetical protein
MLYTKHATITDTNPATLFQVPAGFHAIINFVFVANHGGSTNTVDLYWDLSAVPQLYIFDGLSLNGNTNSSVGNGGGPLFVLHENESVIASTGSAGNVDVAVTFDLIEAPASLSNFNGS